VYQQNGENKNKLKTHPAHNPIAKTANCNLTSFHFHRVMVLTAILRGNAIAVINRNKVSGKLDQENDFTFIHPDHIDDIRMIDGQLWFYTKNGIFNNNEVIHIKGFSTNGYAGTSVLKYAATNLNAEKTAEDFAQTNYEAKGFGLGIIKTEKQLEPKRKTALSAGMENRLGKGGAFNVGVLDEGIDFMPINVNAKEAELIDWKKISIEDIARWLNIGPHKLKHLDKLNYSSIEQQSIDHLSDSILPWVMQFENEYDTKLFSKKEKETLYIKFNINALLRIDAKSRAE